MLRIPFFAVLAIAVTFAQEKPADAAADSTASPKLNVIKEVPVVYPEEALVKGIKGQVMLRVVVSETGDLVDASVISGEEIFQKPALEAVRQWKFAPYVENGKAIPVQAKIPINFGRRIRAGALVSEARLIHRVEPAFPLAAKTSHLQGTVILHAIIGKDGQIIYLQVVSGNRVFVDPTVAAVKQWRYKPLLADGEPVETDTIIEVRYSLGG